LEDPGAIRGLHFFQNGDHLFAPHAGKAVQKDLDGVAGFEVVEKTLHRNTRPFEYA
jgi:hypothetical protein